MTHVAIGDRARPRGASERARRLFDVTAAALGLVLLSPLMLAVALLIRAETPGPVLFRQIRIGRGGRRFRLYKFRKFAHRPTAAPGLAVTLPNDPRMTRVGRWIERRKFDELPQLWNILRGDMSVVGPRPETLDFADCFEGVYLRVLEHTPGLFGPSQAAYRDESALYPAGEDPHAFYRRVLFPAKARLDLGYFPRRTMRSDLLWILHGIAAVLGWRISGTARPEPGLRPAAAEDGE